MYGLQKAPSMVLCCPTLTQHRRWRVAFRDSQHRFTTKFFAFETWQQLTAHRQRNWVWPLIEVRASLDLPTSILSLFTSMWNKKPTRCHLVLYLFHLYKLLNMFRATLCPSSGADDLVVFFAACGVVPWLCSATYSPMDTQPANRIWPPCAHPEDGHKVARNMLSNL